MNKYMITPTNNGKWLAICEDTWKIFDSYDTAEEWAKTYAEKEK